MDFTDLRHIGLACTTTDNEQNILQVEADLVEPSISYLLDGELVHRDKYQNLSKLILKELVTLDFDHLIRTGLDAAQREPAAIQEDVKPYHRYSVIEASSTDSYVPDGGRFAIFDEETWDYYYDENSWATVAIYVWEKVKDYLTKAGTTIFMASILMWAILNFGPHGYTTEMTESFGAILGHWLVPFFAPIGLGFWQIAVALIAGISAKEVVVSSCAVLFGVPNINSGAGMNTLVGILGAAGFGQLNAFCLMIFCLLYIPCAATLATIRKEAASTRWMLLSALFQLVVAWVITFAVYRIGLLL